VKTDYCESALLRVQLVRLQDANHLRNGIIIQEVHHFARSLSKSGGCSVLHAGATRFLVGYNQLLYISVKRPHFLNEITVCPQIIEFYIPLL